jgi:hypothetical protein
MPSLHEFVIERLLATRGNWAHVARYSRVPKRTLEKIARREIKNPGVISIERLAEYFRRADLKQKRDKSPRDTDVTA